MAQQPPGKRPPGAGTPTPAGGGNTTGGTNPKMRPDSGSASGGTNPKMRPDTGSGGGSKSGGTNPKMRPDSGSGSGGPGTNPKLRPPDAGTNPKRRMPVAATTTRPPGVGGIGGGTNPKMRPPEPSGHTTRPPGLGGIGGGTNPKMRPPEPSGHTTRPPGVSGVSGTTPPLTMPGSPPPARPDDADTGPGGGPVFGGPGSLDEVERALSALDGRHENTARVQRETQAAIAAKRVAADAAERQAIAAEKRNGVLKVLGLIVGVAALVGGGGFGFQRYQRKVAADAALAPLAAPYLAAGWKAFPKPIWRSRHRTEAMVGANTCIVALASTSPGTGRMVLERPGGAVTLDTSAAFCTCADERVVLHTEGDIPGGVQLLFQEAVAVGGSGALPFVSPRPSTLVSGACAVDPLDAWLAGGAGQKLFSAPPTAQGLMPSVATALESSDWKLVASAPSDLPFAVIPPVADSCFVALSTVSGEALSLRETGGARPLRPTSGSVSAIGWCTHTARPLTAWRTGTGNVVVYRRDAARVGGTLGLREKAQAMALGEVPSWVPLTERAWDATLPLLMSGVPSADIALPADGRSVTHARIVSLTLGSGHVTPSPDELDRYLCAPTLETNPAAALCVQSTALAWRPSGGEALGIAESPLPFWMDVMTEIDDHTGLTVEQKLLALSRRLAAQHYEATAREGVMEERDGVEVVGRDGDDRIIAIGIQSTSPWVLPYTDGAPWTLDTEPRSIPLTAGAQVHLVSHPWTNTPPDVRRTVVFRHRLPTAAQ